MTVDLTIVPMRSCHLPEVCAIEALTHAHPWSKRLFDDELSRSGRVYVVARVGRSVVGYAGVLMIADDGHVATVSVGPGWQRRGIARRLLVAVIRGAIELGANQLTLEVRASNAGAQALYQRFGFVPGGARKAYYADNGEDAIVMWAHDITTPSYAERLATLDSSLTDESLDDTDSPTAAVHPAGRPRVEASPR